MAAEEPDDDTMPRLAIHARTVLAGARHALLTLPGARVCGWTGLIDDGGEPVLLVGAGSPPTLTAGSRRCRLDVPGFTGERLVLGGQLRTMPGSAEQIARRIAGPGLRPTMPDYDDDGLVALALSVDEVLLCLPTPTEPGARRRGSRAGRRVNALAGRRELGRGAEPRWPSTASGRRIELDAYALAEPDLIAAYAPDLIEHLNTAHAGQLRLIAAAHGRAVAAEVPGGAGPAVPMRPADLASVAGIAVGTLDRDGLTLWQVDEAGAHELRVTFHNPLTEPRSLGLELRRLLTEPSR
ncbi:DUF2470 domain-containing protein [Pseudofrankia inefficax]|uniref:DUF2470 domain-containing protein n=1 Tax=Pseudofrankia inefficax (strain DSM 45817 / CECT 9037 / DDB 130130 / EuI1c) TaxID=298654 RepID=E3IYK4_PSEI1|nr:DUF2470 domain-containing protein [Pseudofrankia inefficax]ADP85075.1 hypothetical protein FraEuI1c_7110 [Pseudofrankia inefficax]